MTQPDDKRENSPAGDSSENEASRTRTRTRTRRRDESSSSSDASPSNGSGSSSASEGSEGGGRSSSRSRKSRSRSGGSGRSGDAATAEGRSGGSDESKEKRAEGDSSKGGSPKSGSSKSGSSRGGSSKRSSTSKSGDTDTSKDEGSSESGDRSGDDSRGGDDDGRSSSGRRRRGRRGRRGRGRSKSEEGGNGKQRSKDTGSDASGKDGSSKGGSSKGDAKSDGTGEGTSDDAVKDAIAKGGTRMAAKRGGSRGGGSRGSRSGGGSRGGGRHQRPTGVSEEVRRAILDGPPRTMLVTSTEERTQIAVLEDRTVVEHHVTRKQDVTYVGNIYMARVQNVLPGMEAAFLDIGKGRNGVLYAGEVLYDELDVEEGIENPRIEDALKQGQKVLVQVTKDPMGSKGPRLTMHLSLAGRYMVLAPNSDLFGISRKLTDKERDRLRRIVKKVKPDHHGVIVRTAAENATEEQLTADLERLLKKWEKAEKKAANAKALTPVYEEPPLVVKVIRDNFGPEFERCVVDSPELYVQVCDYLEEVAPELLAKVELYGQKKKPVAEPEASDADEATGDDATAAAAEADPSSDEGEAPAADDETRGTEAEQTDGDAKAAKAEQAEDSDSDDDHVERELPEVDTTDLAPLFDAYHVNEQLRKAMGRKVWLPSGGYLIIESTEAMKVIDVNTGKFTGDAKSNLEEVVLKTNLEAAEEIVRQLRLRDLGGIIVIDFIDMLLKTNQDQVVRKLKRELLRDRTKTRVSEVSKLGLVQMTRKNVSQGLVEAFSHKCDACEGHGYINELEG